MASWACGRSGGAVVGGWGADIPLGAAAAGGLLASEAGADGGRLGAQSRAGGAPVGALEGAAATDRWGVPAGKAPAA